ncbi:hypothetical protein HDF24_11460 [Mucilaginibacter sp. X4EP1]|uniref:hypothetical protein n=1 Tax=Mucilaginibacter sp. X4EP1 TaxID=2723092 RepID=UPI0021692D8B|nr:hypothetical protein [Mucilaginibacter sp. X4EP1]MCS3816625.1 hypothetical protein [Mucilaginibacter sp. X4EP1]
MENSSKINLSPLEIEIENKISSAYLFSIAVLVGQLDFYAVFIGLQTQSDFTEKSAKQVIGQEHDITKLAAEFRNAPGVRQKADKYHQLIAEIKKHR